MVVGGRGDRHRARGGVDGVVRGARVRDPARACRCGRPQEVPRRGVPAGRLPGLRGRLRPGDGGAALAGVGRGARGRSRCWAGTRRSSGRGPATASWATRSSSPDRSGRRCSRPPGCTARSASATTSCRPRSRPTSASRAGSTRSPTRPGSTRWGTGRSAPCGGSAPRSRAASTPTGSTTVRDLALSETEVLAGGVRSDDGAVVPPAGPRRRQQPGRRDAVGAAGARARGDLPARPGVGGGARRGAGAGGAGAGEHRRRGPAGDAGAPEGPLPELLHAHPVPQAPGAEPRPDACSATPRWRCSTKVEQDKPVRLLGVRLEMVPPEGGY